MAAWTGKTPNGVRINFVYTPRELRGKGYAHRLRQSAHDGSSSSRATRSAGCTRTSPARASPNIFKRIGYWPVSDVAEYYLK